MAEDWVATQQEIAVDFKDDGMPFTFTREMKSEYDPITGQFPPSTTSIYTLHGFIHKRDLVGRESSRYLDGSLISASDLFLVVDGTTKVAANDTVEINGKTYTVITVTYSSPGGVLLTQNVAVRE